MATTTPNYGWPVPTSTDLVKDGATAIEALGDAIDATVFGLPATGFALIASASFSAVTTVSINNCFSATYQHYLIVVSQTTATTNGALTMRLRASGTDNSSANYNYAGQYQQNTTATISGENATGATSGQVGGVGAGNSMAFINVTNPFATATTNWYGHGFDGTYRRDYAGKLNVTTSYDGFTLIYGFNQEGTVRVYGYKI